MKLKKKTPLPEMRSSYLVQRLEKPRIRKGEGPLSALAADNPFSFGGGFRNGGLSSEAMDLLRPLFSFDYMGAAEYEFGAVPEGFQRLAQFADSGDLEAYYFDLPLKEVKQHWADKSRKQPTGSARIYLLAPHDWMPEVEKRVRDWAAMNKDAFDVKRGVFLDSALRPDPTRKFESDVAGWFELNNGFMFFTDETMWRGVARIFGVEVPES